MGAAQTVKARANGLITPVVVALVTALAMTGLRAMNDAKPALNENDIKHLSVQVGELRDEFKELRQEWRLFRQREALNREWPRVHDRWDPAGTPDGRPGE